MPAARPGRPKRLAPPDPASQLRTGLPSEELIHWIWGPSFECPGHLPPYQFHHEAIGFIRGVSLAVKAFLDDYRRHPDPVRVSRVGEGWAVIATLGCTKFLDLFKNSPERNVDLIRIHFPQHQFHPIFNIYEIIAREFHPDAKPGSVKLAVECIVDRRDGRHPDFRTPSDAEKFCTRFNLWCKTIYEKYEKLKDDIKTFERVARDTRYGMMQYAEHLISCAPHPYIAHFVIYRDSYIGCTLMSHDEIRILLDKFEAIAKIEIQKEHYLGYSILLRHDYQRGFWLDGFIFLRDDDLLRWASVSMSNLFHTWQRLVSKDCAVLVLDHWRDRREYKRTLGEMTVATEFNFYCRVIPPGKNHGFWNSQSPIGKLTKRTTVGKKSAARAANKNDGLSSDPLLRALQEKSGVEIALFELNQWEQRVEKHNRAKSRKRTAAAKKRAG